MVNTNSYREGVYYHFVEKQKDSTGIVMNVPVDLWICSVLWVLCIVRTDSGNGHAYLIEYIPHGETQSRRAVLPQALLLGRGEEALKVLRDLGISVLGRKAKYVREYLDSEHLKFSSRKTPDDFWTSVKVIGWEPVGERFILPDQIIGRQTGVWFNGNTNVVQYKKSGDFNAWNTMIAGPCQGNSYLVLALSCAFAGTVLDPLNIPGLGFHYYGDSTIGKSTALVIATSVWGSPKYMITWRTTLNGLEIQAESRSSTLIVVDESHQVDPKSLDAAVYMLLNGTAKARMNRDTSARDIPRWAACVLSSGERSIETHQINANIEHKVGQTVRIVDVPVVTGEHGLFEHIHNAKNGAEFSDALRAAAALNFGHAGPLFVQRFIDNYATLRLGERMADVLKQFGESLSAQDTRVARSFAVVALAGELAIEWGILPWPPRSTLRAAVEIFNYWKSTQPESTRSKETAQIIRGFSGFIETREADFSDADWVPQLDQYGRVINQEPVIRERAGYWKEINGKRFYCFNREGFTRASCGFGARKAAEILDATGALVEKEDGKRTKNVWIPQLKRSLRLYMVDPEKLETGS
jgi:putative DNA primase/helicase